MLSRVAVAAVLLCTSVAHAQTTTGRALRLITSEPGGGNDIVARVLAPGMSSRLGQPVIVENRPTIIGIEVASKAPPDGTAILLAGSAMWIQPYLRSNVPWDPMRDFMPITMVSNAPNIVAVHPSLPIKSVGDLVALAKKRPGELNYAIGAAAGPPHLAGELFKAMAGVNIVKVAYKGTGAAVTALVAGEVQLMFSSAGAIAQHLKSGRLRALAVTTAKPTPLAPGLPTVAASGLPGYESGTLLGMFAPARTAPATINTIHNAIAQAVTASEARERLANVGIESLGAPPEELAAVIKAEMTALGKVIKDAGIRID